jgi:flagellar biosynthesis regulator FlbT
VAKKKPQDSDPRSEGRKVIGEIRSKINEMNTVQLRAFYNGFSDDQISDHLKAIEKVKEERSQLEILKTQGEIKRLQEKLKGLKN